ncbi:MAG: ferrous iron transport protein B [Candidatus Methanosuratus sp.]|nr:ferrous iron transport protein B [Candidatus Methanosuratincola sp.]
MGVGKSDKESRIEIALVGNPNVGKSTIFNQLTGLNQSVGNWPGKTVEIARGTLVFRGIRIDVVDLPGIYSLSAYSEEEVVARDYLLSGHPHVVVNVVDAMALERNLYLTLQLMEMGVKLVVALNFVEDAKGKGIAIDINSLSRELGVPVVAVNAISGSGIAELVDLAIGSISSAPPKRLKYGKEVEKKISEISSAIKTTDFGIPANLDPEWVAIKLMEGDPVVQDRFPKLAYLKSRINAVKNELEMIHGEEPSIVIASERYSAIQRIIKSSSVMHASPVGTRSERIEALLSHHVFGYLILLLVLGGTFFSIFAIGGWVSGIIEENFGLLAGFIQDLFVSLGIGPSISSLVIDGILFGVMAAVSIVISYIFLFYLILSMLEDTGYLPRAAFLLDSLMHKLGLHGKAFIPMLLGYGCSVPACISCRIMETWKERVILGALVVMIPCSARSVIILGVAAQYLGFLAAVGIYLLDILVVMAIGRLLFKAMPGESVGLIMEMPRIRLFKPWLVLKKTWVKTKDFLYIGLPLIVAGSAIIEALRILGLLDQVILALAPFTSGLLGLPVAAGISMIFGILRKEMALVMLATYANTLDFSLLMSPVQMAVFTIFMVLYVPCVATIATLVKEYRAKWTVFIVVLNLVVATLVAVAARIILGLIF